MGIGKGPLGCIDIGDLLKYSIGVIGTLVGIALTIGLWVRSVERDALFATEQIHSLQDENEKLRDAFQMIDQRLSRIEGKLDVAIGIKRK